MWYPNFLLEEKRTRILVLFFRNQDCRRIDGLIFTNYCVEFTRRQATEVAHTLAKMVTSLTDFHIFTVVLILLSLRNELSSLH